MSTLRYICGVPVIFGAVWVLARPGKPMERPAAGALLLYGFVYIVVFHYWLKAF